MSIIYNIVNTAFEVYKYILIARIILSFVKHNPYNPIIRFIYDLSEPYLSLFKRFIPPVGMIDFSPIVAFFVLDLLQVFVVLPIIRILL